jgi:8-oxo-dGTP diphosphatase
LYQSDGNDAEAAAKQYSFENGPEATGHDRFGGRPKRSAGQNMTRVVAAIIERDGRLLICQRRASAILGGKWEFPGGKLRPSESPQQALARELREELGTVPAIGDLMHTVRHRYAEMAQAVDIWFFAAELQGLPRNLAFDRIVWARRDKLPRFDFVAADRQLISRLARREI